MRQQDCPACRKPIDVSRLKPGMHARCPHCDVTFRVGEDAAAATGKGRSSPAHRPAAQNTVQAGQRLEIDGFEEIEFISKGAMGAVYRARESDLGRRVAIKVLAPELAGTGEQKSTREQDFIKRFDREGKALARIKDPNVVRVHRMLPGKLRDLETRKTTDVFTFVMEFVHGPHLRDHLSSRKGQARGLELLIQITRGVAAVHRAGVVHRDLKPENIMLDLDSGQAKVTDFGLAYFIDRPVDYDLTKTQMTMGTVAYMPPEQQKDAKRVYPSGDVYSLGRIGYELLTGQLPQASAHRAAAKPSECNPEIDPLFDDIIFKCLEVNREDRYQDASELQVALEAAQAELAESKTQGEPQIAVLSDQVEPAWVTQPHREAPPVPSILNPPPQVEAGGSKHLPSSMHRVGLAMVVGLLLGGLMARYGCGGDPETTDPNDGVAVVDARGQLLKRIHPVSGGKGLVQPRNGLWYRTHESVVAHDARVESDSLVQPQPATVRQEEVGAGKLVIERRIVWVDDQGAIGRQAYLSEVAPRMIGVGFEDSKGASWVQIDGANRCTIVERGQSRDCGLTGKTSVETPARIRLEQVRDRLRVVVDSSREVAETLAAPEEAARVLLLCQNQSCSFDRRPK